MADFSNARRLDAVEVACAHYGVWHWCLETPFGVFSGCADAGQENFHLGHFLPRLTALSPSSHLPSLLLFRHCNITRLQSRFSAIHSSSMKFTGIQVQNMNRGTVEERIRGMSQSRVNRCCLGLDLFRNSTWNSFVTRLPKLRFATEDLSPRRRSHVLKSFFFLFFFFWQTQRDTAALYVSSKRSFNSECEALCIVINEEGALCQLLGKITRVSRGAIGYYTLREARGV